MEINLAQLTKEELENLYQNIRTEWKNRLKELAPAERCDFAWLNLANAFYDYMEIDEQAYEEVNGKEKRWNKGITVNDENNHVVAILTKNTSLEVEGWFDNVTLQAE